MPASQSRVNRAWQVLQERENHRRQLSALSRSMRGYPAPEALYYSTANSSHHKHDNRYRDVLSYDRTAVFVDGEHGYLNASVVSDPVGNWWVAAQAPLPHTFYSFFRAIYSQSASKHPSVRGSAGSAHGRPQSHEAIIVQLTGWTEGRTHKADNYLPGSSYGQDTLTFYSDDPTSVANGRGSHRGNAEIRLRCAEQTQRDDLGATYSRLELSVPPTDGDAQPMTVHHYLFGAWPDHGVPGGTALKELNNLLSEVTSLRESRGGQDNIETWVHCSAGVGRTGTFIALQSLNYLSSRADQPHAESTPSVLGALPVEDTDRISYTVDTLREGRNWIVQTPEQLGLVYALSDP